MPKDPRGLGDVAEFAQTQGVAAAVSAIPAWGVMMSHSRGFSDAWAAAAIGAAWFVCWLAPLLMALTIGESARSQWLAMVLNILLACYLVVLGGGIATPSGVLFALIPFGAALLGTQVLVFAAIGLTVTALFFLSVNMGLEPERPGPLDLSTTLMLIVVGCLAAIHLIRVRENFDWDEYEPENSAFMPPSGAIGIVPVLVHDASDKVPVAAPEPEAPLPNQSKDPLIPHARNLLDEIGGIVMCLAPDGCTDYVSAALERVLDIEGEAVMGQPLLTLVHEDDRPAWEYVIENLREGAREARTEARLRRKPGDYIWMDLIARVAEDVNGISMIVVIAHDIDERKRAQIHLARAREEAEAASRSKTRFLASVSHELRTPLNAILGFSEVMRAEMFGPLGVERYAEYSDYIHESGQHLLDLINDILDMSKIEAGRYDINLEAVSLARVVERVLKTITHSVQQAGIRFGIDLPKTLPKLHADERAMRQILLNLLSNAVKFTPRDGSVIIRIRAEKYYAIIEVMDTGVGIPAEAMDRLGRPFEQAHRPIGFDGSRSSALQGLSAGAPGTGLGLAIVRALVALQNGVLDVVSEEGVGTVVTVRIPTRKGIGRSPEDTSEAA